MKPQELPSQFGRYRVIRSLGEGGMGTVYLAHDSKLNRSVALKVPHFSAKNAQLLQRFYREARVVRALVHPNICPLYEVGEIGGIPYLTMPYIEGTLLLDCFSKGRPLAIHVAVAYVQKLALALHAAHEKGIIHRDLKPENVIINQDGEPILMDFGLARRLGDFNQDLTREGQRLGTLAYMAPEQALGKKAAVGPPADIYSLGVILYELLTAQCPYVGKFDEVLVKILQGPPPHVRSCRPQIPAKLDAICAKAMAKPIADRFSSMADFAAALNEFLVEAPEETPLPASDAVLDSPLDRQPEFSWVWVALAAGLTMILLAILYKLLFWK